MTHFPPHRVYVEAFGGGAAVLLRKRPSPIEVYNDLDEDVVNFFTVLRDDRRRARLCQQLTFTPYSRAEYERAHRRSRDPIERARRLVVRAYMGFGSNAGTRRWRSGFRGSDWSSRQANNVHWTTLPESLAVSGRRLAGVILENRPAIELMTAQDSDETLFYLDPPYVHSSRSSWMNKRDLSYRHEMTDEQHRELIIAARQVSGMVVLSGYDSPIYTELLADWVVSERAAQTQGNAKTKYRTEKVWLSPRTVAAIKSDGLFAGAADA
jgi:DNA adenine methylase